MYIKIKSSIFAATYGLVILPSMGTPSLSVSSTPGMSGEKKKMSTEEDCSDDTRDKLKDQLLYLMQGYPV